MRIPFLRDRMASYAAHAAEVGRVGAVVSVVATVVVVIAESFRPGVVGAVLPLETALGASAFFIVLSLLADARADERYVALTVLLATLAAAAVGKATLVVFAPEGAYAAWFAIAAAAVAAILVSAARHPER